MLYGSLRKPIGAVLYGSLRKPIGAMLYCPQWASIKNSFSSKFVHFQIHELPNPFASKYVHFQIHASKFANFKIHSVQICWLPNPKSFASKCVHFQIHSLRKFVHFQIHYLCTFKSTHFEICSLPIHSLPISFSAVIVAIAFRNLQN